MCKRLQDTLPFFHIMSPKCLSYLILKVHFTLRFKGIHLHMRAYIPNYIRDSYAFSHKMEHERIKNEKHGKSFSSLIKQYSTHFRSHLYHGHTQQHIYGSFRFHFFLSGFSFSSKWIYVCVKHLNIQTHTAVYHQCRTVFGC